MSANIEYDILIFPQKFFSGDYFFVYAAGDNNVVVLIHTTPYRVDTPEADIMDEYVFDTMLDNIL